MICRLAVGMVLGVYGQRLEASALADQLGLTLAADVLQLVFILLTCIDSNPSLKPTQLVSLGFPVPLKVIASVLPQRTK